MSGQAWWLRLCGGEIVWGRLLACWCNLQSLHNVCQYGHIICRSDVVFWELRRIFLEKLHHHKVCGGVTRVTSLESFVHY